jgi:hypothetical protein
MSGMPPEAQEARSCQSRRLVEWRGTVTLASGSNGQARCRVHFQSGRKDNYTANAPCAKASGSAAQTARVRQVSNDRYSRSFYNSEYSISGVIHIVVRGASQTVQLISNSGSGVSNLSR